MLAKDASSLLPDAGGKSGGGEKKSEDWTRFGKRQILSVGKKKEALRYNEDDDDLTAGDGYHSSSDEEDGRTAAGKEKKKKIVSKGYTKHAAAVKTALHGPTAQTRDQKKSTKTKNKTNSTSTDNTSEMELGAMGSSALDLLNVEKKDASVDDDIKDGVSAVSEVPQKEETINAKKRKKIRSRQKNIRKDHREENDKPSYLIEGTNEYCGRPMTKETRQKLGIQSTAKKNDKTRGGEWVGDIKKPGGTIDENIETTMPKMEERGGTSTLTKIGDCLVNDDAKVDVGHDVLSSSPITSRLTKKQKRKFKNLLVR